MSQWEVKGCAARRITDVATLCVIGNVWAVVPHKGAEVKSAEGMADGAQEAMAAADRAYVALVEVSP